MWDPRCFRASGYNRLNGWVGQGMEAIVFVLEPRRVAAILICTFHEPLFCKSVMMTHKSNHQCCLSMGNNIKKCVTRMNGSELFFIFYCCCSMQRKSLWGSYKAIDPRTRLMLGVGKLYRTKMDRHGVDVYERGHGVCHGGDLAFRLSRDKTTRHSS